MQKNKKIVFVGIGMVGASGLASCISQNLADEYVIIDIFTEFAQGQKLDLEDALEVVNPSVKISVGNYSDCFDAGIIVVSAGRPQKDGETRLQMLQDNVKIIKDIAENIKKSGFSGISLIVSNPVDIMTQVYQQTTNFSKNTVISSGCYLDTLRLRRELTRRNISGGENCYIIGEHGDSSTGVFGKLDISDKDTGEIEHHVHNKAQEIITRKKSTYYGIGAIIAHISRAIFTDSKHVFCVGRYLTGEFGQAGCYASIPSFIGKEGIIRACVDIELSDSEKQKFGESCDILRAEYDKLGM
ncbi:L-lactate dehydrogenase [Candidatus Gracilibacteria bacterium]|nr:L-lactate dehydrogenase [Candidatus Gracilibacteria bacterium]